MKTSNQSELENVIGHVFTDKSLLTLALTHSSYANESNTHSQIGYCNERLEFLGDSVLSFISSEYLYAKYPDLPEGDLSRIRSGAVCEKALCGLAKEINLGDYLLLGKGENLTDGRSRPSILADAFEALLAAIFLDGGILPVKSFLLPRITRVIDGIVSSGNDMDYKSLLQQIVQREHGDILEYVVTSESGPAHDKVFEVDALLNGNIVGHGAGKSKRAAEQKAAFEALKLFGV
ncbi:MAG: ribonuclease III [Firmicutes bacterium]|nr:ribonuclease III [Candidatus Colimorpha enterica]